MIVFCSGGVTLSTLRVGLGRGTVAAYRHDRISDSRDYLRPCGFICTAIERFLMSNSLIISESRYLRSPVLYTNCFTEFHVKCIVSS